MCHVLRKQLFAGIIFPCVLTYKLRTVLNELQWHALLNGPVFRVYIAFLREISDDNGCSRWLLCGEVCCPLYASLKVTKQCFEFYKVQFVASSIFVRLGQSTGNNFQF